MSTIPHEPTLTNGNKAVLSVKELMACLGISRNSAYEAVRRGQIPSIRIGTRILIPSVALEKFLTIPKGGDR